MQTLGVKINGSHIRSVAFDTRTCPRLDCGRVEVRPSMPQNHQLVLQRNASIVNEVPALQDTITKSCLLDLHLKVFHVHFVCYTIFLHYYDAMIYYCIIGLRSLSQGKVREITLEIFCI